MNSDENNENLKTFARTMWGSCVSSVPSYHDEGDRCRLAPACIVIKPEARVRRMMGNVAFPSDYHGALHDSWTDCDKIHPACIPVEPFSGNDRVRHIGGTTKGTMLNLEAPHPGMVMVRWDDLSGTDPCPTRADSLELVPAPPPKMKPHPWNTERDKIRWGDHISLDGWKGPRLVMEVSTNGIFIINSLGEIVRLSEMITVVRVERSGSHGWKDVGND